MNDRRNLIRVLWCEVSTLAVVLTGDIPWWLSLFVLSAIPIVGLAEPSAKWLGSARRGSTVAAFLYLVIFPLDWLYLSGRLIFATVHLTFYLKLHILLHQGSERERSRLHLICLFELLAAASMTIDATFVVPLTLFVLMGTLVLILERTRPEPVDAPVLKTAVLASLLVALPLLGLAGAIFVSLPRPAYSGFRLGGVSGVTSTGFSDRVRLGDFERIRRDRGVVMRIVTDEPSARPPRWRGTAYDRYQDGEWHQSMNRISSLPRGSGTFLLDRPSSGPYARSEVFLEPLDTDVLFLPPASTSISTTERYVFVDPYMTLRTGRSARAGRRYVVTWRYRARPNTSPVGGVERMSERRARRLTQMPELSSQFHALAASVTRGKTGLEAARLVEDHLRSSYGYTLQAPAGRRPDPVENFLFEARAGHCEYFASAMVMMLRSRKVPARLVTGFNRGERNAVGDFEVVRKTNAHAWVEVFDEQRGWVAFDPTPPSPELEGGRQFGVLSQGVDSLRMLWDMYVVAYDAERQRDVFGWARGFGVAAIATAGRGVRFARIHAVTILVGILVIVALWMLARSRWALRLRLPFWRLREKVARQRSPVRFYEKLLRWLARLGIERPLGQTPLDFASELEAELPGMVELTGLYYRARFGDETLDTDERSRAERLCVTIRLAAVSDARRTA